MQQAQLPEVQRPVFMREHARFQAILINVGFLVVGQIFHNIPTWLKCDFTTKCQAGKIDFYWILKHYFLLHSSQKRVILPSKSGKNQPCMLIVMPP